MTEVPLREIVLVTEGKKVRYAVLSGYLERMLIGYNVEYRVKAVVDGLPPVPRARTYHVMLTTSDGSCLVGVGSLFDCSLDGTVTNLELRFQGSVREL